MKTALGDRENELWLSPMSVWETLVLARKKRLILESTDPADRFIVATALVYELTLVTADKRLVKNRQVPVLANRAS